MMEWSGCRSKLGVLIVLRKLDEIFWQLKIIARSASAPLASVLSISTPERGVFLANEVV